MTIGPCATSSSSYDERGRWVLWAAYTLCQSGTSVPWGRPRVEGVKAIQLTGTRCCLAVTPPPPTTTSSTSNNRRREFVDPKPQERLCLYLGTERASVIFTYDITNPRAPIFQGYARPPQPSGESSRLTGPEGMAFSRWVHTGQ